ncbi:MAG: hypothetical protein M3443_09615 [Actinomycetota bacterium]|nr:hypothetical protein [Actinomycetota bacterium]
MRVNDFERWLRERLEVLDHDEITEVVGLETGEVMSPTGKRMPNNAIQKIKHASGANSHVQVMHVRGPGISTHDDYVIPKEAW